MSIRTPYLMSIIVSLLGGEGRGLHSIQYNVWGPIKCHLFLDITVMKNFVSSFYTNISIIVILRMGLENSKKMVAHEK